MKKDLITQTGDCQYSIWDAESLPAVLVAKNLRHYQGRSDLGGHYFTEQNRYQLKREFQSAARPLARDAIAVHDDPVRGQDGTPQLSVKVWMAGGMAPC